MKGIKHKKLIVVFYILLFITITPILGFGWPVPDTGQNISYTNTFGEDSDYRVNPPSFTKLDENGAPAPETATSWAMVRDNVTGLIWEEKNNRDEVQNYLNPHDADNTYTWYDSNPATNGGHAGTPGNGTDTEDFINALNEQQYGGFSDWRLPSIKELFFLVNKDRKDPAIYTDYFPNIALHFPTLYWTSTFTPPDFPNTPLTEVWCIHYHEGEIYIESKSNNHFVRAVRGTPFTNNFIDNGNGTVTDTSTGLMWQQDGSTYFNSMTNPELYSYCENLTLAGYNDWRLPNINELIPNLSDITM